MSNDQNTNLGIGSSITRKSQVIVATPDSDKQVDSYVNQLLLQNSQILSELSMEGKTRRNKNILNSKMCILIHRLERNLIRMAKGLPPECVGDPHHIQNEKNRFINFYKQRSGSKKM